LWQEYIIVGETSSKHKKGNEEQEIQKLHQSLQKSKRRFIEKINQRLVTQNKRHRSGFVKTNGKFYH